MGMGLGVFPGQTSPPLIRRSGEPTGCKSGRECMRGSSIYPGISLLVFLGNMPISGQTADPGVYL